MHGDIEPRSLTPGSGFDYHVLSTEPFYILIFPSLDSTSTAGSKFHSTLFVRGTWEILRFLGTSHSPVTLLDFVEETESGPSPVIDVEPVGNEKTRIPYDTSI